MSCIVIWLRWARTTRTCVAVVFGVGRLEYLCAAVAAAVWCVLDAWDVRLPFMADDASAGLFDLVQDRDLVDQNPWAWYSPRQVTRLVLPSAPPALLE